jgi:hypothetical protein
MGCTCDKNINCNNGEICPCGITVEFINQETGVVEESLSGYGYSSAGSEVWSIEQSPSIFNPGQLKILYREDLGSWVMQYTDLNTTPPTQSIIVASYLSDALCPDSKCGWESNCGIYRFQGLAFSTDLLFTWEGLYSPAPYEQYKAYYWEAPSASGTPGFWYLWVGTHPVVTQNAGPAPRYILNFVNQLTVEEIEANPQVLFNPDVTTLYGYLLGDIKYDCADGVFTAFDPDGFPPRIFITREDALEGYDIEVKKEECGCCDEQLSITIVIQGVEYDFIADVVKDENENVLAINGYQYYSFIYDIPGAPTTPTYYIFFDPITNNWVVDDTLLGKTGIYVNQSEALDCPYGFYTLGTEDESIIQIKGVECFDCCDYYTPRFTNFIRKQRAILVDDTSYIGKKEVFGMKCGGEWEDIFRKHLIIDTLSCLPYGVLCEEEEECLIENLYKNCNC